MLFLKMKAIYLTHKYFKCLRSSQILNNLYKLVAIKKKKKNAIKLNTEKY